MDSLKANAAPKKNLVLYFQVHQPKRLGNLRFFDIGANAPGYHNPIDKQLIEKISRDCYLPTNALLLKLIKKNPEIRLSFSLSGVIMDQFEKYAPEVLQSFRELAATGAVEFLSETYYHSLACMLPGKEFEIQVLKHAEKLYEHFGVRPSVFRNTELIYNDEIGKKVSRLGYMGVITDGVERVLQGRTPNHVFQHPDNEGLKILLRNYRLSDDIAFRFSTDGKLLTSEKYLSWLNGLNSFEDVVTLAMDYETFGEHQKKETGIFKFLEETVTKLAKSKTFEMVTPSQAMVKSKPHSVLNVPYFISWADQERDLSAWLGNEMQRDAFDTLQALEFDVKNTNDPALLETWRNLQTSDHLYYMSTKKGGDGTVHNYFSPYPSPYEAFINFMNVLTDFTMRVKVAKAGSGIFEEARHARTSPERAIGARMTMLSTH
ncbi:MAG TPA: glycoside hydrolase family 57 protein [Chryseosolibacter sp.]